MKKHDPMRIGRKSYHTIGLVYVLFPLSFLLLILFNFNPSPSWGFGPEQHSEVTQNALGFLKPEILNRVIEGNLDEDIGLDRPHAGNHFDACAFDDASNNIRNKYNNLIRGTDSFSNAFGFGELLHPAQDFYSHSNWVELELGGGFQILDSRIGNWPVFRPWQSPFGSGFPPPLFAQGGVPDSVTMGSGIKPEIKEKGTNVLVGYGLFTDSRPFAHPPWKGLGDDCPNELESWEHPQINKDDPNQDDYGGNKTRYGEYHIKAKEFAVDQTRHEWCRYLNLLKSNDPTFQKVSIPMALWVDAKKSPHPDTTQCGPLHPRNANIGRAISISRLLVKNDHDSGSDPGDLNLAYVLYTGDLTRSVRTQSPQVHLSSGNDWPVAELPNSLSMSLKPDDTLFATVQGWDDDSGSTSGEFNRPDSVLGGVTLEIPPPFEMGDFGVKSGDIEVLFHVSNRNPDILWYNSQTGETQVWFMDGHRLVNRATVLGEDGNRILIGPPWSIVGVGDMDGNGMADIVWYNSQTGETQVWFMDGHRLVNRATVLGEDGNRILIGPPWSIVGVGDMDGNGKADIVWYNSQTGETQVWFMDGHRLVNRATVLGEDGNRILIGTPWSIVGVGDMDGNGMADIVWYNSQTGETQVWFMDGHRLVNRATVLGEDGNRILIGPPWSIVGVGDMDENGKADIVWYNSQTGETQVWYMDGHRLVNRATVLGEDGNRILIGPPWSIVGVGE